MDAIDPGAIVADVRAMLHIGHRELRQLVAGRNLNALNWQPGQGTNSLAALVAHALDAERALTSIAAGIVVDRDREGQFALRATAPDELVALVDRLEDEVDGYLARVTAGHLRTEITRPNGTKDGLGWLLHAVAHSREHIGQASLTLQLLDQRFGSRP